MLDILGLAAALVKVRVLKRRVPFFVGWNITFRCNLDCRYCGARHARGRELDTAESLALLDTLWLLGGRWVTFGGGEPLLREDLGAIMAHARTLGFRVFLSTNGVLLPRKLDAIRGVRNVNLSLDGPPDVQDAVRGKGAFEKTLAALDVCRANGIPASFQCVLSSHNLHCVKDVVDLAESKGVTVMFQPATAWLDSSTLPNPIAPPVDGYRAAMRTVAELKHWGKPVRNSFSGLEHLSHWPDNRGIWCGAGRIMCEVEPDGSLLACHQAQVGAFLEGTCPTGDARARFGAMTLPVDCAQCWCAPVVELAMLFSLRREAIMNAARLMRAGKVAG